MRPRIFAIVLLASMIVGAAALAPAVAAPDARAGTIVVGFEKPVPPGWWQAHGASPIRSLGTTGAVLVHAPNLAAFEALARNDARVAYVEANQPLLLAASSWDASSWDASSWDASSWDASSWDASSWDASSWDASSWDASSWDASSWDSSTWDASSWDSSTWDSSTWDSSTWDSSTWDSSTWDGAGPDPGYNASWGLGAANAPDAWSVTHGSGAVKVCVPDTGVDVTHPDLAPNLWQRPDGSYGYNAMDGSSNVTDDVGHGTHVSGILAAVGGNGIGTVGMAQAKVMAVKVMGVNGGTEADLAVALAYCVAHGARIISLSLHTSEPSQLLSDAIDDALAAGVLVIAAAGNEGAAQVASPASHPGVIAVGAVMPNGERANFSNHGPRLDIVAPGWRIVGPGPGGIYLAGSGTSAAVPFVAGAAALLFDASANLTASGARAALLDHARDLGAAGRDDDFGYGALDAGASMQGVLSP